MLLTLNFCYLLNLETQQIITNFLLLKVNLYNKIFWFFYLL